VVIGYDEVNAERCAEQAFLVRSYTAIHGNDNICPLGSRTLQPFAGKTVAILQSFGDMIKTIESDFTKKGNQQCHGSDAVDIVISVDTDSLSSLYGSNQSLDSAVHAGEETGIPDIGQGRRKKLVNAIGVENSSINEQYGI
jgi:hypothetical protein